MYESLIQFIRELYNTDEFIPLHEPRFLGREKEFLSDCIDSTFVSSVGKYVDQFEKDIADYTGAKYAVAIVNGTQALYIALKLVGAVSETEVITQSATFVATANAIHYTGAEPVLLDVDRDTMGLSPSALKRFLETKTIQKDGNCFNHLTGKRIIACVPMHTFGHPCRIDEITAVCDEFGLTLIEDAAESLGSYYKGMHTGTFGAMGIFSFNGNKIITTGGGGMIVTDDPILAKRAKHLTTTAKVPHRWEFNHDEIGYNFRMPNLNAAMGVAQLEQLPIFLDKKKILAVQYRNFFEDHNIAFVEEPTKAKSNYWLNTILSENRQQRDQLLEQTNQKGIMSRPLWTPIHKLTMYQHCQRDEMSNTCFLEERLVNLPSSVII
jgi:perosamine synthetase